MTTETEAPPTTDPPALAAWEDRRLRGELMHRLFGHPADPVRLGPFVVERKLGQGGMGAVYLATAPGGHAVAVKTVLQPGPSAERRLRREAEALAMLRHPNIVPVEACDTFDGGAYVAMRFIEGTTLRRHLQARRLGAPEILALFAPIGRALGATHAAGLVHRDFKPDNVMVDRHGWPWLLDFGLTAALHGSDAHDRTVFAQTLTRTGAQLGTRGYAAPELLLGREVDGRADQFSFCVALYEALCGRLPFSGATDDAVALAAVRGAVDPLEPDAAPRNVQRAILRGLAPKPEARFSDMDALVKAL